MSGDRVVLADDTEGIAARLVQATARLADKTSDRRHSSAGTPSCVDFDRRDGVVILTRSRWRTRRRWPIVVSIVQADARSGLLVAGDRAPGPVPG